MKIHHLLKTGFALVWSIVAVEGVYGRSVLTLSSDLTGGTYELQIIPSSEAPESLHVYVDTEADSSPVVKHFRSNFPKKTLVIVSHASSETGLIAQMAKDLTGDSKRNVPGSGGGLNFFNFIKDEVIPVTEEKVGHQHDRRYIHTTGKGSSWIFSGFFHHPGAFDAYIMESPELTFHASYPFRAEHEYHGTLATSLPVNLIFSTLAGDTPREGKHLIAQFEMLMGFRKYNDFKMTWLNGKEMKISTRSEMLPILFDSLYTE